MKRRLVVLLKRKRKIWTVVYGLVDYHP